VADEVRRRIVHALGALIPLAWLVAGVPWRYVEYFLLCGLAFGVLLEVLRLTGRADWRIFEELTREYERDNPAGYFLYAAGMTLTGVLFPPLVAAPAMLMLTLADPLSGLLYSGGLGRKPVPVMAVTFLFCLAIAVLAGVPAFAGALGALGATLADGATPVVRGYVIDDNVTIPLVAAVAMWVTVQVA